MVDLTAEMAQLWASLGPAPPDRARAVQFVAARPGAGASTFAREFARYAATRARRPVWLVDLNLDRPGQAEAVAADPRRFGRLGRGVSASPDGSAFFQVNPRAKAKDGRPVADARYIVGHRAGASRLWLTRFRRDLLRGPQRAQVIADGRYWQALRRHAETIVVDAPAAGRSRAYLRVAPHLDMTVLVVTADEPDVSAPGRMKLMIEEAGGRCAGIVVNRVDVETPRLLRAVLP